MKRRIVKQGKATLTVSLPSSWSKKHGLNDKDEVDIKEQDDGLFISTKIIPAVRRISVNLKDFNANLIHRYIDALYKQGYEEIEVLFSERILDKNGKKINTLRHIQKIVNNLIGLEIVDQKRNICLLKDLTGIVEQQFEKMLSRIIVSVNTLVSSYVNFLNKKINVKEIAYQHEVIEKFSNYCQRLLNKKSHEKSNIYYNFNFKLLYMADILHYLAREIEERKIKIQKTDKKIFQESSELFNLFTKLFYKFDNNKLVDIISMRRKIFSSINELKFKQSCLFVLRISSMVALISNLIEDLVEIKI